MGGASKIYLAVNPVFETISNIVRPTTEDERRHWVMNAKTPQFEVPIVEPLLDLIQLLIDRPTLIKTIEMLKNAKPGSEGRMCYALRELLTSMVMEDDIESFAETSELDPQVIIDRFNVFSDALEITLGLSNYLIPGLDDNPTDLFSCRARKSH